LILADRRGADERVGKRRRVRDESGVRVFQHALGRRRLRTDAAEQGLDVLAHRVGSRSPGRVLGQRRHPLHGAQLAAYLHLHPPVPHGLLLHDSHHVRAVAGESGHSRQEFPLSQASHRPVSPLRAQSPTATNCMYVCAAAAADYTLLF
jgi:hypothetical protein